MLLVPFATACSPTLIRDGNVIAEERLAEVAEDLESTLGRPHRLARDASWLAATHLPPVNTGGGTDAVDSSTGSPSVLARAVDWRGDTGDPGGAVIEVRIEVRVPARQSGSLGGARNSAGAAVACIRYHRVMQEVTRSEIPCVDESQLPAPPVAEPYPALPPDAGDTVERILATTTPETAGHALRADFTTELLTAEHLVVEVAEHDGRLIVAVGVPAERQCVVAAREPDGSVSRPGFRSIWLEPGELGCTTRLVTAPPR